MKLLNGKIEMGIRILIILNEVHTVSQSIEWISLIDHQVLFGSENIIGLQPLYAFSKILKISNVIMLKTAIKYMVIKNLLEVDFNERGIRYRTTCFSDPFLNGLESEYITDYINKLKQIIHK